MKGLATVLKKECIDNLRDRRTIISSFSLAILGPALFVGMMAFVLNTALGEALDPVKITAVGSDNAPRLMAYLERKNTEITRAELADPRQSVRDGDHDLVLVIPDDYQARYRKGEINALALIHDSSGLGRSKRDMSRARALIAAYGQVIGALRLELRGIDTSIVSPIVVQERNVASPAARALTILATLPYLLVLVVFMGGFYLAIDTTAGEREHGSLEPLLTQPVSRAELVLGKLGATVCFAAMSLVLFLLSFWIAVPFVPLERIGMVLKVGLVDCVVMFLVCIPLMVFAAALLAVVASFAKSYKEAQTYLSIVILVPTMPLIITQLMNVETSTWLMFVPSLSQATLVSDVITGEIIEPLHFLISAVSTAVLACLLAYLAVALYRKERILV
ncbi:MAG: ABC transporter permease [Pseudomonadales bacterium]|jgi:sodium transport system permease protein|nr:ABC transporter permease [Pseudomonadales bacterium]MDP6471564.1 ABC transporter permease [Pseudomonadales bacterium]MDP6828827.1 ABC transporter permease [Pseudomonadales bacterium]MDP6970665.1 ABC transporter permease [Pseudomonadales bacterium]|tara:strand:- start:997 stop:2169 length:1173 start_codon:yes stop_codon:yes gene_type:complete